jgi:eukaryotic-like serine/threonine-protein kinase
MSNLTPSGDSKEGVAFLQQRVAQFGLMSALLGGIFWIFRLVVDLATSGSAGENFGRFENLRSPSFPLHGLGILFGLVLWFLCRGKARSRRYVERAEVVCLLGSVTSYEAMGAFIDLSAHPELIIILALTLVMLARAIFVPGTARRSLVLGVIAGVPLVVSMFLAYSAGPGNDGRSPVAEGFVAAAVTGTWWSMTVTLTTATSRVIYGLRRVAREARQLGQYTLAEKIGEGGMGAVYRASHAMLRRPTAVKLLLPEHTGESQLARFEREVQLTARLTHPNTVTIFDYGRTPDGTFYYAMEFLDGATLETIVEIDGAQPTERVAHVLEQVAGALTEAHGIGLIHRDIKPANIILCDQGGVPDVAKVVDFGLVKNVGDASKSESTFATGEHVITGTPLYLSPEAIVLPGGTDARSDLYSLGAVAYYFLTGQHVFTGKTVVEICGHHLHSTPPTPSERLGAPVSEPLSALIMRCLEKDPKARPGSAQELLEELRATGLARAWDPKRARDWWKAHEKDLGTRKRERATSASAQTIAVDFAGRLDRLEKYLSERTG